MKQVSLLVAAALLAAALPAAAADVGVREIEVPSPKRGTAISATLWYPATGEGVTVKVGDNGIFQGAQALQDAAITSGAKPLVLLSHGGLRSAQGVESWVAAGLAGRGFVVAVPHAPKVKAAEAPAEYWLRPADMAATLTALDHDPLLAGKVDTHSAIGFFLGGTSALALAGARLDASRVASMCDGEKRSPDCNWFRQGGIDLHRIDPAKLGQSHVDTRVKSVVAVNPELADAFTPESVENFAAPVHMISLGDAIPGASPFDAFNECKPKALAILRDEGEDESLCAEGTRPRAEIHAQLLELITKSLAEKAMASQ
jgi:predicted dienelactone hydrolase